MKQKIKTKKLKRQLKRGGADGIGGELYEKFGEVISAVATIEKFEVSIPGKAFGETKYERVDSLTINAGHGISTPNNLQGNYLYFDGIDDEIIVESVSMTDDVIKIQLTSKKIKQQTAEESKAEAKPPGKFKKDKKTEQEVPVYFSERPIKNIGEFIKYAKANKGPSTTLLALARQKDAGAAAAAAAASGVLAAGNVTVTLLASTGVGLPLAGAIAGLLLITNKLANMYIHKLKMKAVLYDVITIVSSCFIIYDLIDRVIMITTIVLNSGELVPLTVDQVKSLTPLPTLESSDLNHPPTDDKGDESIPVSIQKAFKEMTDYVSVAMNLKNKSQARLNQIEKLKALQKDPKSGDSTYKELLAAAHKKKEQRLLPLITANAVDQIPLEDRVSLNIDIQKRLYEKMQGLTEMLLQNAREKDLSLLISDSQMTRSGFGAIVEKELASREIDKSTTLKRIGSNMKSAYNIANRVYSRNFDSDTIRKDVMAELSLVLGYFFLLKNQYDLILDTYKDTIPEWPEIYAIIRETEEFKLLVVPPDPVEYSKKVIKDNEADMVKAALKQNEGGTNGDGKDDLEIIKNPLRAGQVGQGGALKTKKHNKKTKWRTRKQRSH